MSIVGTQQMASGPQDCGKVGGVGPTDPLSQSNAYDQLDGLEIVSNGRLPAVIPDDETDTMSDDHMEQVLRLRQMFHEEYQANQDKYDQCDYDKVMDDSDPWYLWRHLNHLQFNVESAHDNLKNCLRFRKEFGANNLQASDIAKEFWLYGPVFYGGENKYGNTINYVRGCLFRPPKEKVKKQFKQFITYYLDQMEEHVFGPRGTTDVVFDNGNTTMANIDLDLMRWLISRRDCYPSRVRAIFVTGCPFVLRPLIRLIIAWLPDQWRNRVFCGTVEDLIHPIVDKDQLPTFLGGTRNELLYRRAPVDSSWVEDMPYYQDPIAKSQLDHALGWLLSKEEREEARMTQLDYESKKRDTREAT